jgi:hypothetical protein
MSTVDFKITGSVSGLHPSSDHGADVIVGETLTLQIEATPALDLREVEFSVVVASSASAPALVWTPATGKPATPTGTVTTVVPATKPWTYLIRCKGNGGVDASGVPVDDWVKERIVAIRAAGMRHMVPSESTQYDATYGWTEAVNGLVDAMASACVSATTALSPYSIPTSATMVRCNSHAGAMTVLLGAVALNVDRDVSITDWHGDGAVNNITIDCVDSTLNGNAAGSAVVKIDTAYGGAVCHCDGIVWRTLQATV